MDDDQPTVPLPGGQPQGARPAEQPTAAYPPAGAPHPPVGPPHPPVAEPFYKRHGLAFAISTLVLSVVVLVALVGVGAFAAVNVFTHVGERAISQVLPGAPDGRGLPGKGGGNGGGPGQQGGPQKGGGTQQGRAILRGTIASKSSSTWTIDRLDGSPVTVAIDSSTAFGLPKQSATASDFAKGDEVVVVGKSTGSGITATRILKIDDSGRRPPVTPGPPATPGGPDL